MFDGLSARGGCTRVQVVTSHSLRHMKGKRVPVFLLPFSTAHFIPLFLFHKSADALSQPGALFAADSLSVLGGSGISSGIRAG